MSKNFKKFYEGLFKLFRKNLGSNNTNTTNTKNMNQIIRKGHYKNINSGEIGNKDIPIEIIKIIGVDENNLGYWKTDELVKRNNVLVNKSISEYELTNNWIFMNTSIDENPTKILPKFLLDGLGDSNENQVVEEILENKVIQEIPIYKPYLKENVLQKSEIPQIPEDEKFIHNVLSKIKIHEKESIELKIRIPIDYNFVKLKETINLLNLDINKVINFILSSKETQLLINEKMKDKIFEMLTNENVENQKIPVVKENILNIGDIEVIEPEIVKPEIVVENQKNTTITSTDDIRIKTLLDKVSKYY